MCSDQNKGCSACSAKRSGALQVAEALDDNCFDQWLYDTAFKLRLKAIAFYRGADNDIIRFQISEALSKLPGHLQHRVIEQAMYIEDKDADRLGILPQASMAVMLDLLPSHLHLAVLSAAITPNKTLIASQHKWLQSVVASLALLPASPPSILSLDLGGDLPEDHSVTQQMLRHIKETNTAANIASALQHHSSLTSLRLSALRTDASTLFQPVSEAIAMLTSLQELNLVNPISTEALPFLKVALESLPCLQMLSLSVDSAVPTLLPHKRGRDDDEPDEGVPQHCLSSLFSSATALRSLDITELHGGCRFVATTCLGLPCLTHLKVTSNRHNVASALLTQLTAPLSILDLLDESSSCWRSDVQQAQQLWDILPRFQQLRSLSIDLHVKGAEHVRKAALADAPEALASLSRLQELSISAAFRVLLRTVKQVAATATGLQRLRMSCALHGAEPRPETDQSEWQSFFQCLRRLTLQRLDIHINGRALRKRLPGLHESGVHRLTPLTALHVYGWKNCLRQQCDCQALANLQQLQSVCLQGFETKHRQNVYPALVRALGALPCLTQLLFQPPRLPENLCDEGIQPPQNSFQAAFARHAPGAGWPQLQWLGMAVTNYGEAVGVQECVADFTFLKTIALGLDDHEWQPKPLEPSADALDICSPVEGLRVVCNLDREGFAWRRALA